MLGFQVPEAGYKKTGRRDEHAPGQKERMKSGTLISINTQLKRRSQMHNFANIYLSIFYTILNRKNHG